MIKTLEGLWDGTTIHPDEPLDVEPNTRVRFTIETEAPPTDGNLSFFDTALSLNLEGPPDWALNFDEYLYGEKSEVESEI